MVGWSATRFVRCFTYMHGEWSVEYAMSNLLFGSVFENCEICVIQRCAWIFHNMILSKIWIPFGCMSEREKKHQKLINNFNISILLFCGSKLFCRMYETHSSFLTSILMVTFVCITNIKFNEELAKPNFPSDTKT